MIINKRNTYQRIKVLNYLRLVKTHPKAEEVYFEIKKELPSISLATVYRNLNLLAENREIFRFEINGEYRFDRNVCDHQHLICSYCGKIEDVFDKNFEESIKKIILHNHFKPECIGVFIKGKCRRCLDENK